MEFYIQGDGYLNISLHELEDGFKPDHYQIGKCLLILYITSESSDMLIDFIPVVGGPTDNDNVLMRYPNMVQLDANPTLGRVLPIGVPNKIELELPKRKLIRISQILLFHLNLIFFFIF